MNLVKKEAVLIKSILDDNTNLQRVWKYHCTIHNRVHKYSFHSIVTFLPGVTTFYGFDTIEEMQDYVTKYCHS